MTGELRGQIGVWRQVEAQDGLERLGVEASALAAAQLGLEGASDEGMGEAHGTGDRGLVGQHAGGHGAIEHPGDLRLAQPDHGGDDLLVELDTQHRRGGERGLGLRAQHHHPVPNQVSQRGRDLDRDGRQGDEVIVDGELAPGGPMAEQVVGEQRVSRRLCLEPIDHLADIAPAVVVTRVRTRSCRAGRSSPTSSMRAASSRARSAGTGRGGGRRRLHPCHETRPPPTRVRRPGHAPGAGAGAARPGRPSGGRRAPAGSAPARRRAR